MKTTAALSMFRQQFVDGDAIVIESWWCGRTCHSTSASMHPQPDDVMLLMLMYRVAPKKAYSRN